MSQVLNFPIRALPRWWSRRLTIGVIVLLSAVLHAWAVWQLPLDYDEPVYLRAGLDYGQHIRAGDLRGVIDYAGNREHPPLVKLLYSIPTIVRGPAIFSAQDLVVARGISALFGVLTVGLVASVEPTAGLFLALHSLFIKYTSQAYLEGLPVFFSTLAVLLFFRSVQPDETRRGRWLMVSAASLGLAAAGKYNYALVALVIVFLALQYRTLSLRQVAAYVFLAGLVFWAANPYLWRDPLERLSSSLQFHSSYSQGFNVLSSNYPWYQPLSWIATAQPWHPGVFFFPTMDAVAFVLAVAGLYITGRKQPWLAFWPVTLLLLLFIWPTKWPQYALLLVPPVCLLAGLTLRKAVAWGREQNSYWDYLEEMLPQPPRIFWWATLALVLALFLGKVGYEIQRAIDRRGWSELMAETSPLPSNTIYDVQPLAGGTVALATGHGAVIWQPEKDVPWGTEQHVLGDDNEIVASGRVCCVLMSRQGHIWLGTELGAARQVSGGGWTILYSAEDMGLPPGPVRALAEDSQGGIWVGTLSGLANFDGQAWRTYQAEDGLLDPSVFTLAVQHGVGGDVLWVGGKVGISRLDLSSGKWSHEAFSSGLGWRGVADLLVDSSGQVWAATLGGGLRRWDGSVWTIYRPGAGGMPSSVVNRMTEAEPGEYWLGFGFPTEPGGQLASFDGQNWRVFSPRNSGYNGGEPMALYADSSGLLWAGTAGDGLVIFDTSELDK